MTQSAISARAQDDLPPPSAIKTAFLHNMKKGGWTPLTQAANNNSKHWTKWLLKAGANPNFGQVPHTSFTPMHFAAIRGNVKVLTHLLNSGGDKNLVAHHCKLGNATPLKLVKKSGNVAAITLLSRH